MPEIEQNAALNSQNLNAGRDISITINNYDGLEKLLEKLAALNVPQLVAEAEPEKKRRSNFLSLKFWQSLQRRDAIEEAKLGDPGVQLAITEALSSYIRSGNEAAADLLAELLAERALNTNADVRQFCLDGAISVAAKLDREHLNALSMLLFTTWTRYTWDAGCAALYEAMCSSIIPFGEVLNITETDMRYLEAVGCTRWGPRPRSIQDILREKYPGYFTTGFDVVGKYASKGRGVEGFPLEALLDFRAIDPSQDAPLLIPCHRDDSKFQINGITPDEIEATLERIEDGDVRIHLRQGNEETVTDQIIAAELIDFDSRMASVIENWDSTSLNRAVISAIGVTIADANARRVFGDSYDASMDLWLPPRLG